jgi:hypothetical protein
LVRINGNVCCALISLFLCDEPSITHFFFLKYFIIFRPNGVSFVAIPMTTALSIKHQLKPGDIVTFKHKGFWLGNGKPKVPTIYRLRSDKTWEEVVNDFHQQTRLSTGMILLSLLHLLF